MSFTQYLRAFKNYVIEEKLVPQEHLEHFTTLVNDQMAVKAFLLMHVKPAIDQGNHKDIAYQMLEKHNVTLSADQEETLTLFAQALVKFVK